jgi:hypothetical protein
MLRALAVLLVCQLVGEVITRGLMLPLPGPVLGLLLLVALLVGASVAIVSAVAVAASFGVPKDVLISLARKSVTAAVAMSISDHLGGIPALTAVLVAITGVLGSVIVTPLMNVMGLNAVLSSLLVPVFVRLVFQSRTSHQVPANFSR